MMMSVFCVICNKISFLFMKKIIVCLAVSAILLSVFMADLSGKVKSLPSMNNDHITKRTKKIILLPLGNKIPDHITKSTYAEIRKYIPDVELADPLPLPQSAYYAPRNRYRADSLIKWISQRANADEVIMGITAADISTTKGQYADWGVMGLAYNPGKAGVASTYRLKNKASFWKIVIHELGHTSGLPHCPVKTCFMRDAEGGDHTGEEKEFCSNCRKRPVYYFLGSLHL